MPKSKHLSKSLPWRALLRCESMRRPLLLVAVVLSLLSVRSIAQIVNPPGHAGIAQRITLSSAVKGSALRCVIGVDPDDAVDEYCRQEVDGGPPQSFYLNRSQIGVMIRASGGLDLSAVLPSSKVPVLARRVTLSNGALAHVILAWGYSHDQRELRPEYSIYEVLQTGNQAKLAWSQEDIAPELREFMVGDLNGDSKIEIADIGRYNGQETISLRELTKEGEVQPVQHISAGRIFIHVAQSLQRPAIIAIDRGTQGLC